MKSDLLKIGGKKFKSRLIVGTGKYKSFKETKDAILASKAEIVTVAVKKFYICLIPLAVLIQKTL